MTNSIKNITNIDKPEMTELVESLNLLLSDYQVYFHKLQNFHWNVRGRHFFMLHEVYEKLYRRQLDFVDEVAERIRFYREYPISRMSKYIETADAMETSAMTTDGFIVMTTLTDLEHLIVGLQKVIRNAHELRDEVTADILIAHLRAFQNDHWQLTSWMNDAGLDSSSEKMGSRVKREIKDLLNAN